MINMLDAERRSAEITDFEVVLPGTIKNLRDRIEKLETTIKYMEREVLTVKRAATGGAWCRRNHTSDGY